MALESSGSKQEWGIQPGCFFSLILLRMGASFQQWAGSIPLGLLQPSPCCRIPPPTLTAGSSCICFVFLPSPQTLYFHPKTPRDICFSRQTTPRTNRHKRCRADLEIVFQTTK